MANGVEDLQMLRLIRAFQKLIDQDARRMVLLYVEEQVQKQQAKGVVEDPPAAPECASKSPPSVGRSTTGDS